MLVRETKAHSEAITSLSKIEFADCKGVISGSKDGKVLNFSKGLDVWGKLSMKTEARKDEKWHFPSKAKLI